MQTNFNFVLAAFLTLVIIGCKKEEEPHNDHESISHERTSSVADQAVGEVEDAVSFKSMVGGGGCNPIDFILPCAMVTESSANFPKTITIDFGSGCVGPNGHVRSGIIHVHLTDDLLNIGAVRTVTFENFSVGETVIEGSRMLTNSGANAAGLIVFDKVVDITLTNSDNSFQRDFTGEMVWVSGHDTPVCFDNVFWLSGAGSVTRPNGTVVSRTILEPLHIDYACPHISQGIISIAAPGGTIIMDFGDGACDNTATVTGPNGQTQTIFLGQ